MIFPSNVAGIPCQVKVLEYAPAVPATPHGPGGYDWHPPEAASISFQLLDRKGYPAAWLEKKLDKQELEKILEEIDVMLSAEYYEH